MYMESRSFAALFGLTTDDFEDFSVFHVQLIFALFSLIKLTLEEILEFSSIALNNSFIFCSKF